MKPFAVTFLIFLKIEGFGTPNMVHFSLHEHVTIHVLVKGLESEFKNIKLVVKHKCVH
jgi:hypothetical protein